jgi:hypothetical protein
MGEEEARIFVAEKLGGFVCPTKDLPNHRAMIGGKATKWPDFFATVAAAMAEPYAAIPGGVPFWLEAKWKDRHVYYGVAGRWTCGANAIDLKHYKRVQTASGMCVVIAAVVGEDESIWLITLDRIAEVGQLKRRMFNGKDGIWWPLGEMERVKGSGPKPGERTATPKKPSTGNLFG